MFKVGIGCDLQSKLNRIHKPIEPNHVLDLENFPPPDSPTDSARSSCTNCSKHCLFSESVVLQHPLACKAAMDDKDTFTVVWDSGASMCVSPDKKDFIGPINELPKPATIQGIGNNLRIEGVG